MNILITGASGMLGRYLRPLFDTDKVTTLQRHDADIECDLTAKIPYLGDRTFDLVIHAAGTTSEADAISLNLEGTKRLLTALEATPPKEFVYVSSWEVYSQDAGENVEEDHPTWASTKTGQSKALAEKEVKEWSERNGVKLTTVRPARMMGKGVKGEMQQMFDDVVNARYIHVRGNEARLSLVCALDAARAIKRLHHLGGTYNITDGKGAKWIELADAMSDNCGQSKRQTFLPEKWAAAAWKYASWVPAVKASLSPATLARRSKTLTLSDGRLRSALPDLQTYETIKVISRTDKTYPYAD